MTVFVVENEEETCKSVKSRRNCRGGSEGVEIEGE